MKKILITGSKGRIGRDLKEFLSRDYKIIEFEKKDKISGIFLKKVDAIIHLASLTPKKSKEFSLRKYIQANAGLTKKILFYASKHKIKTVIIPMTWSWMFVVGDYQYSKLLQEKIASEYKKLGLNVIILEFPEVINNNYNGVIKFIIKNIISNRITRVDNVKIRIITTRNISDICKEFIEGNDIKAEKLYEKSIKTLNLYTYIEGLIKKDFPDKLKYLKKGKTKLRSPIIHKNKTITFPDFEINE